jgi:hypothetical protein
VRRPADTPVWKLEGALACHDVADRVVYGGRNRATGEGVIRASQTFEWLKCR